MAQAPIRCRHCGFPIYPTQRGWGWRHVANGQSGRTPCNGMLPEPDLGRAAIAKAAS